MTNWQNIASLARLAPTPHNTQPYRIRPLDDSTAEIVALPERFLPEEDHGNLYVASAFGILAVAMERASAACGVRVSVLPREAVDVALLHLPGSKTLGIARIEERIPPTDDAQLLDSRRTSRVPYDGRSIDPEALAALARVADEYGQRFIATDDPGIVDSTLRLNVESIVDNLQLDQEREEIRQWYRTGRTPEFGDGLWQKPMNQTAFEMRAAFAAPRAVAWPGIRQVATRRYLRTQRGTRHIGLLCGPFRHWPDLVRAGKGLMTFWLEMTRHGVYMQPMGSMLTNADYAAEVARRFAVDDCWLIMRMGYSNAPPAAPRLETILIP